MFAVPPPPPPLALPGPLLSVPQEVQLIPDVHLVPYGIEIPNRVFVGGCPYDMTEKELADFFSQFGPVKDSKIIFDRATGKSLGYGFVTYLCETDAMNVYSSGSIYYNEKKLNVSKAVRKHGGQYGKPNQEYVNGHQLYMHPSGYLLSQYDGGWQCQPSSPHTQPAKPCYAVYVNPGVQSQPNNPYANPGIQSPPNNPYTLQSPTFGPPAYVPLSQNTYYTPAHFTSTSSHPHTVITTPTVVHPVEVQQIITSKPVSPETENIVEIESSEMDDKDMSEQDDVTTDSDKDKETVPVDPELDDSAYTSEDRGSSSSFEDSKSFNPDEIIVKRFSPRQIRKTSIQRRNPSYRKQFVQPIISPASYPPRTQSVGILSNPAQNHTHSYHPTGYTQW